MGNFEKLSVLVIVVIIVMILVVALYTWTDGTESPSVATGPAQDTANLFNTDPLPLKVEPAKAATPAPDVKLLEPPPAPVVAPTPPPEPPKPEVREHVIASGDTLEKISKTYYGSSRHTMAIEQANPGLDAMRLRPGKKIVIPDVKSESGKSLATEGGEKPASTPRGSLEPGGVYTVRRGDSLPEIARRTYGKIDRWHEIWLANYERIDDPDRLATGTRLNLPN
jgi:nucleoid-associated protein YgaU